MAIDKILSRLPSHFNKSVDSNNYKALSLVVDMIDDSEKLYDMILKFWDVDQAEGYGLDRLGKDEGISRGSYDDETYRKMIKIQFIVNMSTGDIESINTILRAYMGDNFLGLEEGWTKYLGEPAALIANVDKVTPDLPYELLKRIKAAGVEISVATQRYIDLGLNIGGASSNYLQTHISPPKFEMPDLQNYIYYGALVSKYEKTDIGITPFTMADISSSRTYGGVVSSYKITKITAEGVI